MPVHPEPYPKIFEIYLVNGKLYISIKIRISFIRNPFVVTMGLNKYLQTKAEIPELGKF